MGAMSWLSTGRVATLLPVVSQPGLAVSQAQTAVSQAQTAVSWPCATGIHGCVVAYVATQRRVSCSSWSRYTPVYCDPISSAIQAASITIKNLYRDTAFPLAKPAFQTTMSQYNFGVLRHNSPANYTPMTCCVTIQFPCITTQFLSPTACPKRLCHDTIFHCIMTQLGSSPNQFMLFFFPFFTHNFFFHSCYWKNTQINMYIYFFFSFSRTPK